MLPGSFTFVSTIFSTCLFPPAISTGDAASQERRGEETYLRDHPKTVTYRHFLSLSRLSGRLEVIGIRSHRNGYESNAPVGPQPLTWNRAEDLDTFDGAKPRFLNRGKKRRSVSTLSIPRASDRGVEWVDFLLCRKCTLLVGLRAKLVVHAEGAYSSKKAGSHPTPAGVILTRSGYRHLGLCSRMTLCLLGYFA